MSTRGPEAETPLELEFSLPVTGGSGLESSAARNTFTVLYDGGTYVGDEEPFEDEDAPKAFLNYLLFDENYALVDFGFDQVDASADIAHDLLSLHVDVSKKGYLYVFVSNENPYLQNVYFDDVKIVSSTNVEQVQDYYPFGLGFNRITRLGAANQSNLFIGKEIQEELDLGWLDHGARMYQPEIGRWNSTDPAAELAFHWTPFRYGYNNPIRFFDRDGRTEEERQKAVEWARNYMKKYGAKAYTPFTNDCASTVSGAIMSNAGFKDLRHGPGMPKSAKEVWTNGVARIVSMSRRVKLTEARAGDILT